MPSVSVHARFLRSRTWYARRERYFRTHAKLCRACGAGSSKRTPIHLHHLTYVRRGKERNADLVPLCKSCHEQVHRYHRGRGKQYLLWEATVLTMRRISGNRTLVLEGWPAPTRRTARSAP